MERAINIINVAYSHGIEVEERNKSNEPYVVYVHNQWAGEFYSLKDAAQEVYKHLPSDVQQDILFQ